MTTERHPDIEIYIKNSSVPALLKWLGERFEDASKVKSRATTHELSVVFEDRTIPVMIQERVVGKPWISIWFNSDATPWATDLDCAKEISETLGVQTRCIINGWQEGDEPDEWWRLENGQQEKVIWNTN